MGSSPSGSVAVTHNLKARRLYQVWRGNNRFFCGGRLVFGPDVASIFLTIILIAGPAFAFCAKIYIRIKHESTTAGVGCWCTVLVVGSVLTVLRNYRFFFMFISTSTILCMYVFVFTWINIARNPKLTRKRIGHDYLSDFLILYSFIAVWFVGGLTVFHFYLICTNQTTYENFRYRYDTKENPYNRGRLSNIKETLFSRIPPSMNDFRSLALVDEPAMLGSAASRTGEGSMGAKPKIDIEMGTRRADDDGIPIPEILRNFDHNNLEDDWEFAMQEGLSSFDPFFSVEQELPDSGRSSVATALNFQSPTAEHGVDLSTQSSHAGDEVTESAQKSIVVQQSEPSFLSVEEVRESAQRSIVEGKNTTGESDGRDK